MKLLNKEERFKKAQAYLKQNGKELCLIVEDGNIFNEDNRHYAENRAREIAKDGKLPLVEEIKLEKPKAKASKPKGKK